MCLTVHWWFGTQYLLGLYSNTEINLDSEPAPASGPLPYTSICSADSSSSYILLQPPLLCADWWLSNIVLFLPKSILSACILATNLGSFPGGLSHVLNTLTYSPTLTTKYQMPALWWQLSREPRLCACISFDWLCGVRGWDNCNFWFLAIFFFLELRE